MMNDSNPKHLPATAPSNKYQPLPHSELSIDKPSAVPNSTLPQRASWLRIYVLCIANFGISASWSFEFALTTPYFSKGLQASTVLSHAVWIVGPLSGLIVAPLVGTLSDRCTSQWGRRRPFILAGVLSTIIGMLLFSHARQLAEMIHGTSEQAAEIRRHSSIVIAIFAFSVMDLAINTTMWPVRALQGDLVPPNQQHELQSASLVMGSLGDLGANFLVNSFEKPVEMVRVCFFIVALTYFFTVSVLLFVGRETPVTADDPNIQQARAQSLNLFDYLRGLPPWMWKVGTTYAFGFFMIFCTMPNTSNWVGSSVLHGDPTAAADSKQGLAYERGVRLSGRAGLVRAFVQILFSASYPYLLRFITPGKLLSFCFALFSILVATLSHTNRESVAQFLIVMMAFPQVAQFTLPVGFTVEHSDESNRGRFLGALNCFAVIPQLIDTTYTGYVSEAFGEATVMMIGAAWGLITSVHAFFFMNAD